MSSSPPLAPLAPICVAMAAMLKRTQAFSYSRFVVMVKGTLLLSQELVSKHESHLKYILRPLKGTFASRFPKYEEKDINVILKIFVPSMR